MPATNSGTVLPAYTYVPYTDATGEIKTVRLMTNAEYRDALVQAYREAPSNETRVADVRLRKGRARVTLTLYDSDTDDTGAVDQALFFKALRDAATLAAESLSDNMDVHLQQFNLNVTGDTIGETLIARARVTTMVGGFITVQAMLSDESGNGIALAQAILLAVPVSDTPDEDAFDAQFDEDEDMPDSEQAAAKIKQVIWETPFGRIFPN